MIEPISTFTLTAAEYTPPVVVPRVIVYPSAIRLGKYSQQSPSSPLVTEIIEYGDYFSPSDPQPPDSQVDSQVVVPVAPSIVTPPRLVVTQYVTEQMLIDGLQIGPLAENEGIPYIDLQIVATGTNLTYQWRQNNIVIPNSNSATLRIYDLYDFSPRTDLEETYNFFTCTVSNELGSVSSSFLNSVRIKTFNNYYPVQVTNYGSTIPPIVPTNNDPSISEISFITPISAPFFSEMEIDLNSATFSVPYRPYANLQYEWSAGNVINSKKITFEIHDSIVYELKVNATPSNFTILNFPVSPLVSELSGSNLTTYQSIQNLGTALLPTNLTQDIVSYQDLYVYNSLSKNSGAIFNTNFWAYSQRDTLNFSGVSFKADDESGGGEVNATLITPQHFITAAHYPPVPGQTIYFYRHTDGSPVPAVVESTLVYNNSDFMIGKLVSPITDPDIKIYPIISDFLHNYYDLSSINYKLPIFAFAGKSITDSPTGARDYGLSVMTYVTSNESGAAEYVACRVPTLSEFSNTLPAYKIGKNVWYGDSANPVFCITSAGLTLMCCFHSMMTDTTDTYAGGPSVAYPAFSTFIDEYLANSSNNPNGYNVTRVSLGMPGS